MAGICFNELLAKGVKKLSQAGIKESLIDARLLLEEASGKSWTELLVHGTSQASSAVAEAYLTFIKRRIQREPVAYIIGEWEFWSLPFYVCPDVLIPRQETEFLLETVLKHNSHLPGVVDGPILDLCCGSGIIGVVLARELQKKIIALDISRAALKVAGKNVTRHNLQDRILLVQGDLLEPFGSSHQFSLIVANPPYVSNDDVRHNLQPEVCRYEPHLALDGGHLGMELIDRIFSGLPRVLQRGGHFFMEFGADQGDFTRKLFNTRLKGTEGFETLTILQDYSGRDRVVHISRTT
ncbi:peptide chain release factor N(5)-glutamine methyltransferase [Desulforhopalus singaporensis]|uniref:Release factor glutamine methyltransferase n=1 Tax=Desulforhopalus singaporensis TaxID=91360 RepID=A0A1H0MTE8_9BACT|nr:peptide chain release factor N(5)-glutamine methyltransferase [Desulforhopalus singaporensis]SDO83677.1 release factor glutamine methyltransferase [Desulforhopalus singaporensis]